jgi:hypothetical protein
MEIGEVVGCALGFLGMGILFARLCYPLLRDSYSEPAWIEGGLGVLLVLAGFLITLVTG